MLRVVILSAFLLWSCSPKAQDSPETDKLKVEFSLPKKLKEVSGMAMSGDKKTIWAIEDQGNKNTVYGLDLQGRLSAAVPVENADNHDWEDITSDPLGNLYIGDFGNNGNDRQNLSILKIDLTGASQKSTRVTQTTKFHYEGQTEFPPAKSNWLYDCEAFVEMDGSFYLFTKNRSKGFDGTFLVFRVPNRAGDFEAKLVGTLQLQGGYSDAAITSAAISPAKDRIILLNHKNIQVLTGFSAGDFSKVSIQRLSLDHNSQKEAVVFLNDHTLLIADEKDKKTGGKVYRFSLPEEGK
ncbi:hypothetical protein [uncultured Chryseobacterium sp.]|uniref:hypothetical protein n=1 Tax=uncultured Chryseobacterium sp. TaxID=259322 RepID=UPI0025F8F1FF|nr:hypothetical protein [uncultured Chryseobacterium sp.]